MTEEKRGGWGGPRPGGGRKPIGTDARRTVSFSLPPDLAEWLDARAQAEGVSKSESLARILEVLRSSGSTDSAEIRGQS